jgi:hypothetical protein
MCKTVKIILFLIFSISLKIDFINSSPIQQSNEKQAVKPEHDSLNPNDDTWLFKNDNDYFPGKIEASEDEFKEDSGKHHDHSLTQHAKT